MLGLRLRFGPAARFDLLDPLFLLVGNLGDVPVARVCLVLPRKGLE